MKDPQEVPQSKIPALLQHQEEEQWNVKPQNLDTQAESQHNDQLSLPKLCSVSDWVYNLKKGSLFLDRQFDQGLHCLPFCLHLYNTLLYG